MRCSYSDIIERENFPSKGNASATSSMSLQKRAMLNYTQIFCTQHNDDLELLKLISEKSISKYSKDISAIFLRYF